MKTCCRVILLCAGVGQQPGETRLHLLQRNAQVSKPRLVGGQRVLETFPLPLNDAESAGLRACAEVIRAALDDLGDNL
jgi:malate/lactate dehydrogenase